jgi:hypothetical protein
MIRAGRKFPLPHPNQNRFVVATGEFRPPKAGEWFLSGAVVEGYRTVVDLDAPYHIAKLEPAPPLCSICRRHHGKEITHACE